MANVVNQPSAAPTRKLVAMTLTTILANAVVRATEAWGITPWLAADADGWREAASVLIAAAVSYFLVRDRPNVPVDGSKSGV